jgi:hypothetical protein
VIDMHNSDCYDKFAQESHTMGIDQSDWIVFLRRSMINSLLISLNRNGRPIWQGLEPL